MATDKQIAANKRNAQKSTGPMTEEGRRRSSRNALKHGLTAEQVTINKEEARQFQAFRDDVLANLSPEGAIEEQLAERIAICWWRLRRVYCLEVGILRAGENPGPYFISEMMIGEKFQRLSRYEIAIERSLHRALHELERWQARRKGDAVVPPIAVDVTHSTGSEEEPTTVVTRVTSATDNANAQNAAVRPHGSEIERAR